MIGLFIIGGSRDLAATLSHIATTGAIGPRGLERSESNVIPAVNCWAIVVLPLRATPLSIFRSDKKDPHELARAVNQVTKLSAKQPQRPSFSGLLPPEAAGDRRKVLSLWAVAS